MSRSINPQELATISDYVYKVSGVVLQPDKGYLVESRLGPLLQLESLGSYEELVRRARLEPGKRLQGAIIDAITTHETSFFRDRKPFELLVHKLVPDVLGPRRDQARPRLDIWSAACSHGQEVYSIAMALKELLFHFERYRLKILGTDISEHAVARASRGWYSSMEIARGLSRSRQQKHFVRDGNGWRISDELRAICTFLPLNLMGRFRHVGVYDIIFCRNVAIYFSRENRRALYSGLAAQLRRDGVLVVGSTESLYGLTDHFQRQEFHGATFYRKLY